MYTIDDYLYFRGDLSFKEAPVNEIDEMVFASMGKVDYTGILGSNDKAKYSDCFNRFVAGHGVSVDERMGLLESKILIKVLDKMAHCIRYSGINIACYVNKVSTEEMEQMCALTVLGPDKKIYVTFRGTDDTLIGWKENCELAILDSVPAQRDAVSYLETVASKFRGPIVILGHSKGGNLAVYSAAKAGPKIQSRIEKVVSYDGPGFLDGFFKDPGYMKIKDKVTTMVPTASIVGMLMNHAGKRRVIECEKDGASAHDIFYWNLGVKGFINGQRLSEKSLMFHRAINKTLREMDLSERQEFVDEVFEVLSSTGAFNLMDLTENSLAQALKMAGDCTKSKEIRQFILMLSQWFIKDAVSTTFEELQGKLQYKVLEPVKAKIAEKKR